MNTPAYDMTAEIQTLYYAALMIIGAGAVAVVAVIALIIKVVNKIKKRGTHGNQRTRKQMDKR